MKIKYFSLKLMRLLCTSIYFLTFLASFSGIELLISVLLGIFTLGHLIGVFSCFGANKVFTAEVALESVSLDALFLCLPTALLLSAKLGII